MACKKRLSERVKKKKVLKKNGRNLKARTPPAMAAKVLDGLFIGDALASMDIQFLMANKITRIINCAGLELENLWEDLDVEYLTFPWPAGGKDAAAFDVLKARGDFSGLDEEKEQEGRSRVFLNDDKEEEDHNQQSCCPCLWLEEMRNFVDGALEVGEGVLIHSQDGRSRACSCMVVYLMGTFGWDLEKSIAFVQCNNRPDLFPQSELFGQLKQLDDWVFKVHDKSFSDEISSDEKEIAIRNKMEAWCVNPSSLQHMTVREVVLHNTFINSSFLLTDAESEHRVEPDTSCKEKCGHVGKKRVLWIDCAAVVDSGEPIARSPFSKRPIPERPPGPSYRSLNVSGFWIDSDVEGEGQQSQQHGSVARNQKARSPNPAQHNKLLSPCNSPKAFEFKSRHQNVPFFHMDAGQSEQPMIGLVDQGLSYTKLRQRLLSIGMADATIDAAANKKDDKTKGRNVLQPFRSTNGKSGKAHKLRKRQAQNTGFGTARTFNTDIDKEQFGDQKYKIRNTVPDVAKTLTTAPAQTTKRRPSQKKIITKKKATAGIGTANRRKLKD